METGSCRDGLHADRPNENRGGESVVSYLLGLVDMRLLERMDAVPATQPHRVAAADPPSLSFTVSEVALSQATFLNRQALYLRPDPARVIVRPFKPADGTEGFRPTDKTRANHIVDRVLALDDASAASQLADVLENFQGRHRNLLATFEARADEMEDALSVTLRSAQFSASLSERISSRSTPSRPRPSSTPASLPIPTSRSPPRAGCVLSSASVRSARAMSHR